MDLDEARAIMDGITLPSWVELHLKGPDESTPYISATLWIEAPDWRGGGKPQPWSWEFMLYASMVEFMDKPALVEKVLLEVVRNEVHEIMEQFKVDGELYCDPHEHGEVSVMLAFPPRL